MKVLIIETEGGSLRSKAIGWGEEDSDMFAPGKPIGLTPGPIPRSCPETVLEALADGWRLLGPPTRFESDTRDDWKWWLTKE